MLSRIAGALLVVGLTSSFAAPAGASLPKLPSKRIVPGKSIGGVRLGMSLAAAQAAWGPGGRSETGEACQAQGRTSCIWKGGSIRERALLGLDSGDGSIASIQVTGGPSSPLARLRTSKGFGIGTKAATLLKLYPFFPVGLGAPPGTGSVVAAPGPVEYFISRTSGRVLGVQINKRQ